MWIQGYCWRRRQVVYETSRCFSESFSEHLLTVYVFRVNLEEVKMGVSAASGEIAFDERSSRLEMTLEELRVTNQDLVD